MTMKATRIGVLLVGLAVLAVNAELAAKCLPPTGSVRIKGSDGSWTSIENASMYLMSDIGTFHLSQGDSLEVTIFPDCPASLWLTREGVVVTTLPTTTFAVFLFADDGEYRVEGDISYSIGYWPGIGVVIDHDQSANIGQSLLITATLGGALNGTTMRTDLWSAHLLPTTEPYTAMGYTFVGGGGESIADQGLYGANSPIVDWIILELRSALNPAQIIYSRACLLSSQGILMNMDRSSVNIPIPLGNYHVAVRHRNHLGTMTALPVHLTGSLTGVRFNWNIPNWGADAQGIYASWQRCLWPGNVNFGSGVQNVKYTGVGNDRDLVLQRIGSTTPNGAVPGYWKEDVNLDGLVKYTGSGNDRDFVLTTTGSTTPNGIRAEQLP